MIMISGKKLIISLGCILLLSLQLLAYVHCVEEEEPSPQSPKVTTPSTGGVGGGGKGNGGGGRGASTSQGLLPGYSPYTYLDSLGRQVDENYCDLTPLVPNELEYDSHCRPGSSPKWPCFSHDGDDDLSRVTIEPWWQPLNMTNEIVLKEPNNANEFTLKDPSVAFTIRYHNTPPAKLKFYDYEPDTGCYKIHLSGDQHGRIHVSTTNKNYRDIDTAYYRETGKRLCSKFISIGTRKRDRTLLSIHESDNSGI